MLRRLILSALVITSCAGEAEVTHETCPSVRPMDGETCNAGLLCGGYAEVVCACGTDGTFLCHGTSLTRDGGVRDGGVDGRDAATDGGSGRSTCPALRPQPGVVEACVGDFTCVYPRDCVTLDPINSLGCACSLGEFVCSTADDPCPRDAGPRDGGSGDGGADGGVGDAG